MDVGGRGMRVLITTGSLASRGGPEMYVRDLTVALARAGHTTAIYSPILGEVADDFRAAGATVLDRLNDAPWVPDVVHGQHSLDAMTALCHFPATPAVFVSHGWTHWSDIPPRHPRILRYVAVDAPTRDSATQRCGIPGTQIRLVPNFVDLERYGPRSPLPPRPRRALVLSNYAREDTHLPVVREACLRAGIALDVAGYGTGRPVRRPERILPQYDLVFAKGRAALEAVVVGTAVVVCDAFGLGPMVTTENMRVLRALEGNYLQWYSPLRTERLEREIGRYDPNDAAEVTRWARTVADADHARDTLVALYQEAGAESAAGRPDPAAEARAVATYLAGLSHVIKEDLVERDPLAGLAVRLRNRLARLPLAAPLLLRLSAFLRSRFG